MTGYVATKNGDDVRTAVHLNISFDTKSMDRLREISDLMQFQARMPASPFMTRDEAYDSVGCGPRFAIFAYATH